MSQMEPEIEAFVEAERRRNFGTAKSYSDRLRHLMNNFFFSSDS
jgi:hypothetical protein